MNVLIKKQSERHERVEVLLLPTLKQPWERRALARGSYNRVRLSLQPTDKYLKESSHRCATKIKTARDVKKCVCVGTSASSRVFCLTRVAASRQFSLRLLLPIGRGGASGVSKIPMANFVTAASDAYFATVGKCFDLLSCPSFLRPYVDSFLSGASKSRVLFPLVRVSALCSLL